MLQALGIFGLFLLFVNNYDFEMFWKKSLCHQDYIYLLQK